MSTLHLLMASGEAFDSAAQATEDFETNLRRGADATVITEVTAKGHRPELLAVAKRLGLHVHGGIGDTCIVTPHRIVAKGAPIAHQGGADSFGKYAARDVPWVTIDWAGERVTVIGFHAPRPRTAERRRKQIQTVELAAELAQDHSQGSDLGFLLADLNEDMRGEPGPAERALNTAGITTAWKELGYTVPTGPGGGCIDLGASVNADRRVRAVIAVPWPLGNSDHPAVSFVWDIGARA